MDNMNIDKEQTQTNTPKENFKKQKIDKMSHYKDISNFNKLCSKNQNFCEDLKVKSFLNTGSTGVVYSAETIKNPKLVALKLVLGDKKNERKILRETHLMRKIKHPNVTKFLGVYELGEEKEFPCIVMEYADYGDLTNLMKLMRKKSLSETFLSFITLQTLKGLLQLKINNIVHLDIKPQNLLLDDKLILKITDFSVSMEINEKEDNMFTLPTVGTSYYISPEVLSKASIKVKDLEKLDIYSLGVTLFLLAFSCFPYQIDFRDRDNFQSIYNKINRNNLTFPHSKRYSWVFKDFLSKLLNNNIEKRLSILEALNHPWIQAADLIFEEKEKVGSVEKFFINMTSDNIFSFNRQINSINQI